MQKLLILTLFFFLSFDLHSQDQHIIDSLQNELNKFNSRELELGNTTKFQLDSLRVNVLLGLADNYVDVDQQNLFKYANEVINISEKNNYKYGIATGYGLMGIYYDIKSDYKQAIECHNRSLAMATEIRNNRQMANANNELGLIYYHLSIYDKALTYLMNAAKMHKQGNDAVNEAIVYGNIGNIFLDTHNQDEALAYYNKSLEIAKAINRTDILTSAYINIGNTYFNSNYDSLAFINLNKGIELCKQTGQHQFEAMGYRGLAGYYMKKKEFKKAEACFLYAIQLLKELDDLSGLASLYVQFSELYNVKGLRTEELNCLQKAIHLADSLETFDILAEGYQGLSKFYEQKKDFAEAFKYQVLFKQISDSAFNVDKLNSINQVQLKYELSQQQDRDSSKLVEAKYNSELKLQRQRVFTAVGIILLAVAGIIVFIIFRNRKKLEQQRALIEERSRISRELHDDVGSTLSSIRMMSEIAKKKLSDKNPEAIQTLDRISDNSSEMQDKMGDLVWALSSYNEGIDKMISRIRKYAGEITEEKNVVLHFDADDFSKLKSLTVQQRQNIYLIAKEAINNAMKYSGCHKFNIKIKNENKSILLSIEDNGKGFDSSVEQDGNGMRTMKKRAEEISAELNIISQSEKGTTVNLVVKTT